MTEERVEFEQVIEGLMPGAMVTELGPTSLQIQLGPLVGPRAYYEGVLEESPRILGAKDIQLAYLRNEGEHVIWRVDWKE